MTTLEATTTTIQRPEPEVPSDEAALVAAAFLARYSGRTLDAYRHDLRAFFQWAVDAPPTAGFRAVHPSAYPHAVPAIPSGRGT